MNTRLLASALALSLLVPAAALAQGSNSGSSVPGGQPSAQNTQTLPQEIKQKLENQGFSNVQVVPGSFIVSAKDKQGEPVNMVIGPHSMMIVTSSNVSDTSGGNQQQSTGTQSKKK